MKLKLVELNKIISFKIEIDLENTSLNYQTKESYLNDLEKKKENTQWLKLEFKDF